MSPEQQNYLNTSVSAPHSIVPERDKNQHFCYIVENGTKRNTYAGYTVNPTRRLRQHNGALAGGAKYTKTFGPIWTFALVLTSPNFDNHRALSLEYHMKPHGKRTAAKYKKNVMQTQKSPIGRRIDLLCAAMKHPKFHGELIYVYVCPDYRSAFQEGLREFQNVIFVEELCSLIMTFSAPAA